MHDSSTFDRIAVWLAWGEQHVLEASQSCKTFKRMGYPTCLITDISTKSAAGTQIFDFVRAVSLPTNRPGLLMKCGIWKWLPEDYDSFLFADTDTRILNDVDFGFEKAEMHGMALAPSVHYNLDAFFGFDKIMQQAGVKPRGQLQYNSGFFFFTRTPEVQSVFKRWDQLADKFSEFTNDQPFLSLALEMEGYNPYVLSSVYNYRGLGMPISGKVRVWHSRRPVPKDLHEYTGEWPLRYVIHGKIQRYSPDPAKPRARIYRVLEILHLSNPLRKIKRSINHLVSRIGF